MQVPRILGKLAISSLVVAASVGQIAVAARADAVAAGVPVNAERQAYYGDLHLMTAYSFSTYAAGIRTTPTQAYEFAHGKPVTYQGQVVRRSTPALDFVAVTDQAENMGLFNTLDDPQSAFSRTDIGRAIRAHDRSIMGKIVDLMLVSRRDPYLGVDPAAAKAAMQSAWRQTIDAANRHYEPGRFTTFIAYHWTSHPERRNLHRNVVFRGNSAPAPFSAIDSILPEDLWTYLETSRTQGYDALAIPHNSNLSDGLMFDRIDGRGQPIDRSYAERRAAHEPLVEISNIGQSETHPALSPNDAFAHFELFGMEKMQRLGGSYVRDALGRGLEIAQQTGGSNPYAFGFVGATDYHNGLSDSAEQAYGGTYGAIDPTQPLPAPAELAERRQMLTTHRPGSGSLTGVWAEQNTRESIFAALRRKETFATSGTRLRFRFFGGWDYQRELLERKDWVTVAYRRGVPMGGNLPAASAAGRAPTFAIWASKDPQGANLDRLQVIKLSVVKGRAVETVYDVAFSDGRQPDPKTGAVAPVGNTVDVTKATYTNTIGAPSLSVVWQDPRFASDAPAVYYLRVLEIPTPHWSTLAKVRRGESLPDDLPAVIQERGWSSPIWYIPREGAARSAR